MITEEHFYNGLKKSLWKFYNGLKKSLWEFGPLLASVPVIILGWALMLFMGTVELHLTAPDEMPDMSNAAGEAIARMKTGLTFLFLCFVSVGVFCFVAVSACTTTPRMYRKPQLKFWFIYTFFIILLLIAVDHLFCITAVRLTRKDNLVSI